ncbi:MAG: putative membrane protein [Phycisphaerales bacterium]|jgi:uncharacterized membrane protein
MLDQLLANTVPMLAAFEGPDIAVLAIGGGLTVGVIGILFGTIGGIANKRQEEQTKREIAAYVAEGSISPADAESIIRSNPKG